MIIGGSMLMYGLFHIIKLAWKMMGWLIFTSIGIVMLVGGYYLN
jgi:hypothetical protein